jgi:NTP pyrophosphatase (non-canonical NTP hydrolase)
LEIKQLVINAHENAAKKGFHNLETSIISKLYSNTELTDEECNAVINAFKCEKLLLVVTEVAEATEALRKGDTEIENFKEEIADIAIRVADLSGCYGVDLDAEIIKKMETNKNRPYKHNKTF